MIGDTKTLEPRDETETLLPPVRDEDDTEMRRSNRDETFKTTFEVLCKRDV